MASELKIRPSQLYAQGVYVWTERQAELLRARRFKALDLESLIEEVEAFRAEKSKVLNNASAVIEHLLQLQYIRRRNPEPAGAPPRAPPASAARSDSSWAVD